MVVKMIVYIDIVILSMILVDYAILKVIAIIYKDKVLKARFILAIIFSIGSLFLFLFPLKKVMILRYFVGILIVIVAYPYKNYKELILKIVSFYLLNIAFIGTITIFKIKNIFMLFLALLFVLLIRIIESYQNVAINDNIFTYKVKIGELKLNAYLDTGNLTYYKGIPVVFIKDKYKLDKSFIKLGEIELKGINSCTIENVYEGPPLYINNTSEIVYYIFNSMINYDVILNRDCLEGTNDKTNF